MTFRNMLNGIFDADTTKQWIKVPKEVSEQTEINLSQFQFKDFGIYIN